MERYDLWGWQVLFLMKRVILSRFIKLVLILAVFDTNLSLK